MEYRVAVDPVTGWGRVTISGYLTAEDCRKLLEAAWAHPEYSTVRAAIWELINVRTSMGVDDLMRLSSWMTAEKAGRGAKAVALVAADDLGFGVGRMFQAVQPGSGWTMSVFRDCASAAGWLQTLTTP